MACCDYVVQDDRFSVTRGQIVLYFKIFGARRPKWPLERQLAAWYAAITSSKLIPERKLSACYAAITSSKLNSETQPPERYAAITSSEVNSER